MLISNNTQVRKNYFDSNTIQKDNVTLLQCFPKDYFAGNMHWSKCFLATSSKALFCMQYVGNLIYHKFSHGDTSYMFNGENVVMLELQVDTILCPVTLTPRLKIWTRRPEYGAASTIVNNVKLSLYITILIPTGLGKQCRSWSDCSYRSQTIRIYSLPFSLKFLDVELYGMKTTLFKILDKYSNFLGCANFLDLL